MNGPSAVTPLLSSHPWVESRLLWKSGAMIASLGIVAGAYGAHGLGRRSGTTPEGLQAWQTASQYAVYNGLTLLLVSLHPRFSLHRFSAPAIAAGGLLFSGSIMALVLGGDRLKFLGPITPIGGMLMIAG
ncbi:hypothetical protein BDZ94DRAFT_1222392 [Collybia nuda]|uniref:DUF423-domain-containing protein n=1 Tax=Collybia nuda TaxID=64659 RepID=A0A9P6CHD6_9AGAR|nr:hypothetical protein BDZ94DRAFT_1222392 [Collybia nuda]